MSRINADRAAGRHSRLSGWDNAMSYKNLLVNLGLRADNSAVLAIAAELVTRFGARAIGVAACQPYQVPADEPLGTDGVIGPEESEIVREFAEVEAQFRAAMHGRTHDVQWRFGITLAPLADFIAEQARAADLIVTGHHGKAHSDSLRQVPVGDLVMRAGRPVLLVPQWVRSLAMRHAFVGWKEGRETRRAAADAIPLLREASRVTVLEICAQERRDMAQNDVEDVAAWLVTHGVNAVAQSLCAVGGEGEHLRAELLDRKCDLLVAGAYGHAQLREWAFGGVTRDMLLNPDFCVLISH